MTPHKLSLAFGGLVTLVVTAALVAQQSGSTIPTDRIFEALALREGQTLCEMGAGCTGRVYTSELGDDRIKTLRGRVASSGLSQISVVAGDPVKTNFPDGVCDVLFMRNVYHHFADPAAINTSIAAALKPGGRLAVVDFAPPDKEAERPGDRSKDGMHGVSAETVSRELHAAGFEPVSSEAGAQRWFMVVVVKPRG